MQNIDNNPIKPTFVMAVMPILLTMGLMMLQLFVYDDFTPHIPLTIGICITAIFGKAWGFGWDQMESGLCRVVAVALPSLGIMLIIGMIIGGWIISGTVPALIYYGLKILNPSIFLVAGCLVCSVIFVATGTSWGTIGTVGLALVGIGEGLGIPMGLTGGAIVSGAFFGDKISPLSDTTNMAPAVCGTDLWSHIKGMLPTTIPSMTIALILYGVLGMKYSAGTMEGETVALITTNIANSFNLSPLVLLPPLVVIVLAVKRMPALPSLFVGVLAGGLVALISQGGAVHDVFNAMQNGFKSNTGVAAVDTLLSKGGLMSMLWTVSLMMIALAFGGILEKTRCLEVILDKIVLVATGRLGIVAASTLSSIGTNTITGEIYLSIALPGRMFAPAYRAQGLSITNLTRSVEDGGTLVAPLIPWNVGGAFTAGTLGISTLAYAPFAFACWLSPCFDILWAATGFFCPEASDEEKQRWIDLKEPVRGQGDGETTQVFSEVSLEKA
ncbi:MAG TPA: Na+/H+ antiporter NhaC [Desulfovibrio sp.]|nr:Na+/H+ antiporter NhaC [Desulfovibrio sp.]